MNQRVTLYLTTVATTFTALAGIAHADDAASTWSQQIIDRPLTLNQGMVDVHGELVVEEAAAGLDAMGNTTTAALEGLVLGASAGLTNELEVGVDYTLRLNPNFSGGGPLTGHVAFRFINNSTMSGAIDADVAGDDLGGSPFYIGGVGAAFRYNVVPKLAVYTPGYQLGVGISSPQPITLDLPVGVAVQATSNVYAFLQTDLATFGLKDVPTNNDLLFRDYIPVTIGASFSPSNQLDLGVALVDDLKHASDAYAVLVTARVFKL